MKQKWYINRISFRILLPAVAGLVLYMAMLMVFGNLEAIFETFFSQEALFIILLTYINHEWSIFLLGRRKVQAIAGSRKILGMMVFPGILVLSTAILTSGIILVYFVYILKYYHFLTELVTINILMILFQLMMYMYYISMLNIQKYNDLLVESEEMQGKQLELELESFKAEMKPDLLMECLENLLSIMRHDTRKAEHYIQSLSNQYRYLLDNRQKEFVSLDQEVIALKELIGLLNGGGDERMVLDGKLAGRPSNIIPGTLQNLVFNIENTMILNKLEPMEIKMKTDGEGNILLYHPNRPRLVPGNTISVEDLDRSYRFYTGKPLEKIESKSEICWKIPALPEIRQQE